MSPLLYRRILPFSQLSLYNWRGSRPRILGTIGAASKAPGHCFGDFLLYSCRMKVPFASTTSFLAHRCKISTQLCVRYMRLELVNLVSGNKILYLVDFDLSRIDMYFRGSLADGIELRAKLIYVLAISPRSPFGIILSRLDYLHSGTE